MYRVFIIVTVYYHYVMQRLDAPFVCNSVLLSMSCKFHYYCLKLCFKQPILLVCECSLVRNKGDKSKLPWNIASLMRQNGYNTLKIQKIVRAGTRNILFSYLDILLLVNSKHVAQIYSNLFVSNVIIILLES